MTAQIFVLAANPFATAKILSRTPQLEQLDQLRLFRPLVEAGPHTQVSLRIAFSERILWPGPRTALIAADSEFDLTLFAQEQAWDPQVELGDGVESLWTVTACVATVAGRLHKRPLVNCTKEQFIEEVMSQLFRCQGLNTIITQANGGKELKEFSIRRIEVWHEWQFSTDGIHHRQPKWVNRTGNQQFMPTQLTPVANLLLAGAHTKTDVDVWSIEAAVESGRRAAQVVDPSVTVLAQYYPKWLLALRWIDNLLFRAGLPNVLNVLLLAAVTMAVGLLTYVGLIASGYD